MKTLASISSLLALFLFLTPVASAQINPGAISGTPTRTVLKQELLTNRQATREEFKQKLAALKDERKQAIVEKIDTAMQQINSRRTAQMTAALERLSEILDRIADKAGDDPSVATAITNAQTAITTAKQAVETQQTKDYIITITGETTLGQTVKTAIKSLRTDLEATHATVKTAQQAVIQVAKLVMQLQKTTPTVTPN
ncbi:MAG: hypothetical protein AAB478_00755 [Patescibacteria group bacterium]